MKFGDLVCRNGSSTDFGMVLSAGPHTIDVVWIGGSTTRTRRELLDFSVVPPKSESHHIGSTEYYDSAYETRTRDQLLAEATAAREERRAGAGVRRGQMSPSR